MDFKFISNNVPTWANYAIIGIFILCVLNTCNSCSSQKEDKRMRKEIVIVHNEIDSLINYIDENTYTKEELDIKQRIFNLELEKSTLHNMNEIVLKNIRPARRINEIDIEIKKLEEKLEER